MKNREQRERLAAMTADVRLSEADRKVNELWTYVSNLVKMHESNEYLLYRPEVVSQIPPSYAAHAFNILQHSVLLAELVKLCALWDDPDLDTNSIPTIVKLVDHQDVKDLLRLKYRNSARDHMRSLSQAMPSISIFQLRGHWRDEIKREMDRFDEFWGKGVDDARKIIGSAQLSSIKNFRNHEIAHNLEKVIAINKTGKGARRVRYGDEKYVLTKSVDSAFNLNILIRQAHFDYSIVEKTAKRSAADLWLNCKLTIGGK